MADEQNDQQDQHEESDDQNDAQSGGKQDESSGTKGGFTAITSQEDLDRIIRARLGREKKSIAKEIRDEIESETKAATAKEQGDFKKLYEDLEKSHRELKANLEARDLLDRKRAAARKHNLPDDLIDRLSGETDDELDADAKALAKLVIRREAPDTDADRQTTGTKTSTKKQNDPLTSYEFGKREF